ncbi:MAG: TrmH family RNA methyltransferase [Candidatus Scatovivens sp.]
MLITSKENDLIKHIKKLKDKKYRDENNEFIIEGIKMLSEAIQEKINIKHIIICDDCDDNCQIPSELMYEIAKYNMVRVSQKVFKYITDVTNPQGILAVVEKNKSSEIDYKDDFFVILDDIQDPGNIGTILRTADSINLKQIIVSDKTADAFNPKVVRSTMGAIFRVNVIVVDDLTKTVRELKKHKVKIYATDLGTDKSIYDVNYKKTAIIIGNESKGVSEKLLNIADERIKIPMTGKTESLNAGVATGIILYEKLRQEILDKFL